MKSIILLYAIATFGAQAPQPNFQSLSAVERFLDVLHMEFPHNTNKLWFRKVNSETHALRWGSAIAFLKGFEPNLSSATESCKNTKCTLTLNGVRKEKQVEVQFRMAKLDSEFLLESLSVKETKKSLLSSLWP